MLAAVVLAGGAWFSYHAWLITPRAGEKATFVISEGLGADQVAQLLQDKGIISSAAGYRWYGFLNSEARHPRSGTYGLHPGMSYRQLSRLFGRGPGRVESELRIIEGWSLDDEAAYLESQNNIKPAVFYALAGSPPDRAPFDPKLRTEFPFLKDLPADRTLEGYLFPETYRVWDDLLPEALISKQLGEFQQRTAGVELSADNRPLVSLDQVIILASIVEKEVSTDEDRKLVAGIFLRRLREGMALQSDATLNYVTHSGRTQANDQDLLLDSPYNTYRNKGLPPGPICNPGQSAIEAVLKPTASKYWYFLADKQGKVLYAATLEEHKANRYRAGY
jgi:UPF0755 protein